MENKILALLNWYNSENNSEFTADEIDHLYDNTFAIDGCEYLVVTDEEANNLWDESLENYIEECILPEVPESFRPYFDNEKWKRDARFDGRGHSLSSYDGKEHDYSIDGETYYIYRTN
jgi:hypothetical protein